ncbi:MAG: fatty acid desaturase, partial [Rhodospirillales bacterium]|nr:fatty acid desaturase [Rhodospirillales bacterium]
KPKPVSLSAYLLLISGLPYWRERIATTLAHAAGRVREPFVSKAQRDRVMREARVLLGVYGTVAAVSIVAGSWLAVGCWIVPALIGQPFLRLFLLAEHTGCPLVPDMLRNSRTTRSNALVRWLAWNMPYHAEHHAYPALPFHALPAAHTLLKDQIVVQAPGYLAVQRQIIAGLRG